MHTKAHNAPSDVFCYRRGGRRTVSNRLKMRSNPRMPPEKSGLPATLSSRKLSSKANDALNANSTGKP